MRPAFPPTAGAPSKDGPPILPAADAATTLDAASKLSTQAHARAEPASAVAASSPAAPSTRRWFSFTRARQGPSRLAPAQASVASRAPRPVSFAARMVVVGSFVSATCAAVYVGLPTLTPSLLVAGTTGRVLVLASSWGCLIGAACVVLSIATALLLRFVRRARPSAAPTQASQAPAHVPANLTPNHVTAAAVANAVAPSGRSASETFKVPSRLPVMPPARPTAVVPGAPPSAGAKVQSSFAKPSRPPRDVASGATTHVEVEASDASAADPSEAFMATSGALGAVPRGQGPYPGRAPAQSLPISPTSDGASLFEATGSATAELSDPAASLTPSTRPRPRRVVAKKRASTAETATQLALQDARHTQRLARRHNRQLQQDNAELRQALLLLEQESAALLQQHMRQLQVARSAAEEASRASASTSVTDLRRIDTLQKRCEALQEQLRGAAANAGRATAAYEALETWQREVSQRESLRARDLERQIKTLRRTYAELKDQHQALQQEHQRDLDALSAATLLQRRLTRELAAERRLQNVAPV